MQLSCYIGPWCEPHSAVRLLLRGFFLPSRSCSQQHPSQWIFTIAAPLTKHPHSLPATQAMCTRKYHYLRSLGTLPHPGSLCVLLSSLISLFRCSVSPRDRPRKSRRQDPLHFLTFHPSACTLINCLHWPSLVHMRRTCVFLLWVL